MKQQSTEEETLVLVNYAFTENLEHVDLSTLLKGRESTSLTASITRPQET